jgi:alanyl-tRNA synthetase
LRFDFTSSEPLGTHGLQRITDISSDVLLRDIDVRTDTMPYDDAVALGAMALFGEKYGDVVRVVQIGDYSRELCGGTHVVHTSDIGPIVVLSEASVGSGVRRIEALTGDAAYRHLNRLQAVTADLTRTLHTSVDGLVDEVQQLQQALRERERTIDQLRVSLATSDLDSLLGRATSVDGVSVLATRVPASDRDTLLQIGDRLRDKLQSGVLVLGSVIEDKPALLAMVTKDLTSRGLSAGKLIQETAPIVGGRGGGRPELAQGGGTDATKLDEALAGVVPIVQRQISA